MIDIEKVKEEYNNVLNQLSDPGLISDWKEFEKLSKKKKDLEKIINKVKQMKKYKNKLKKIKQS